MVRMRASLPAAAILAGGRARRFGGRDKSRLVVLGLPIIIRQVQVLQRVAAPVFVVGPDPARFADLGLAVYADRVADAGALGGLYTALDVSDADLVITVACDLPFLDAGLLAHVARAAAGADAAWVRTAAGVEPLIACYRRTARAAIRDRIAARQFKLANLADVLRVNEVSLAEVERFGPAARLLANINSPGDYARLEY